MKGRTDEEGIDPVTDKPADNASVRGELENRRGGKHGTPQERTMIEEILDPAELWDVKYIDLSYWIEISGGSRLSRDAEWLYQLTRHEVAVGENIVETCP